MDLVRIRQSHIHGGEQATWSQKYFIAKRKRLILKPVKFQHRIMIKSTNFQYAKRGLHPQRVCNPQLDV